MKKIIYKGTIEENDYNRVKDIDSENYVTPDGKTVLPKLAQMPLRDLAILSFTSENELKKYYTGNEEYCKHPIKYPFSLLYFHCTFAFAILHELLTYFHYDTRTI